MVGMQCRYRAVFTDFYWYSHSHW